MPREIGRSLLLGAVFSLALSFWSPAAVAGGSEAVVTVTGQSAHSYDAAKEDALRKAVEQGAGVEVFSDTSVLDFALRHDTIIARAAGYVRSYDILNQRESGGVYSVTIRAVVKVGQIRDDWGALQILLQRKGRPNILVLVSEAVQGIAGTGNAAEYKLRDLFLTRGFDLVDDEALGQIADRDSVLAMLEKDPAKAAAIAVRLRAGYIVDGRAPVRIGPPEDVYGLRVRTASANLLVKMYATDNARLIASKSVTGKGADEDATNAAKRALDTAAEQIGMDIVYAICQAWSRDLDFGAKFDLLGTRIPTKVVDMIVERLRVTDGVKSVQVVDHNTQLSTLSVVTRLEPRELGKALVKASGESVEVTGMSPGRVDFAARSAGTPPRVVDAEPPMEPGPASGGAPSWLWPAVITALAVAAAFVLGMTIARKGAKKSGV